MSLLTHVRSPSSRSRTSLLADKEASSKTPGAMAPGASTQTQATAPATPTTYADYGDE